MLHKKDGKKGKAVTGLYEMCTSAPLEDVTECEHENRVLFLCHVFMQHWGYPVCLRNVMGGRPKCSLNALENEEILL